MSENYVSILMLGDLIGTPGIKKMFLNLSDFKKKEKIHLVIANGENADNGFGIKQSDIDAFREYGVDVITSGNHIWANEDAEELLNDHDYLLRPANYPNASGKGWWIGNINETTIGVINLLGRYFMTPIDCPFQTLNKLLKNELKKCSIIIVDFHAEYPAEKKALAYEFDGQISLLAGTHTHVQTADEMILPNGTGYITDLGMCGGIDSIIGIKKDDVLKKIRNQIVVPYIPSEERLRLQGIIAKIDVKTKKCVEIKRFNF